MSKKHIFIILQIIWLVLSPFIGFEIAKMSSAVDWMFIVFVVLLTVSQWLVAFALGKLGEGD